MPNTLNRRILVVDDMPSMHQDFRKTLSAHRAPEDLSHFEAELFGEAATPVDESYEVDSAYRGREGLDMVVAALAAGRPYARPSSTCACRPAGTAWRRSSACGRSTRRCRW
ncbi:hypothetical protein HK414_10850 [Ramlibacter terrae]|uniref:Response regulatory domain-containing protein n=1 Tax=Ramlibacter terrae TaxID=2732511 RepID=A0ABX6P387_9BURK|nr:hypothetical protein HK414_10850 [Ramlibacter terrae]